MNPLDNTTPEDAQQALADTAIVDSQVPVDNLVMQDAENESELAQVEAQAAPGADRPSSVKAPPTFEQQVAEEQKKGKDQELLKAIIKDIVNGKNLSEAIKQHKEFTLYEYHSLRIGEQTGTLW